MAAANDSSVGFSAMAPSLINFLPLAHTINADQIAFQRKEHAQVADTQPVFLSAGGELFHIPGQIVLQRIKSPANVPPLLFG
jgi:hypothetical protein